MKRLGLFALAMALVMTLSQCKKDDTTTPANDGEKVPITLKVSSNGAKHEVTPSTGEVTFEDGDVLHVASNGVYLGTLEYQNSVFSGEINMPTEGLPLQFYFLGNVTPEFNSNNTECSVVISDQTTNLPVISYNTSKENYETGKTDYNARLMNQCALVKFEVTSSVPNSATSIMGMNNRVTVTFGSDEFGYDQVNDGKITLPAGEGERWAILLPQNEIANAIVRSADEMWEGSCGTIPAIAINDYLTDGILVAISHPTGVINSLFSVSASDQVYFSKGNLQYQASTNTWRFAENQWDYVGGSYYNSGTVYENSIQCNNELVSNAYNGWIDLFCWGTSGYDHGAICYQPWSTSTNNNEYYAYGINNANLYDYDGTADWGYNAISNGGGLTNDWRTLTSEEWNYVFNVRGTPSGVLFAKAVVNERNGVIILPDSWNASTYYLMDANKQNASFQTNIISISTWLDVFEENGAVFIPAAGSRNGTTVNAINTAGYYMSSSYFNNNNVYGLFFRDDVLYYYDNGWSRKLGCSVRLVQDYQP
ncbi:MAG: hypothetical protein J6P83_00855 [Bacteroidales bacterium]|nr:hypothetical protein [Bacteroidales bacterium]